jgi:hypothetical protein
VEDPFSPKMLIPLSLPNVTLVWNTLYGLIYKIKKNYYFLTLALPQTKLDNFDSEVWGSYGGDGIQVQWNMMERYL